jgi:predicted dehydrogenase
MSRNNGWSWRNWAGSCRLNHRRASEQARKAEANQWISADSVDVENWANLVIGFEDGSRGNIIVSDVGLGGLNTRVTAFMTDGVIKANMTSNDAVETYAPSSPAILQQSRHADMRPHHLPQSTGRKTIIGRS